MLPIKEDNKFFSRFLTKESSTANPSFRVYYGGNSVAVPFVWEAKPGTPKHTKHNFSNVEENKDYLPPLTPPPSYYLNQPKKVPSNNGSKRYSSKIFLGLFPKSLHRRQISSASSSSSSTLSCHSSSMLVSDSMRRSSERSSSLSLSPSLRRERRRTLSSPGSLFDLIVNGHEDNDEQEDVKSPRSVMCFGLVGSRRIRSCSVNEH
ncbi:uncharacterized protein LOC104898203 [Beta vulgaris subsp. vulgaris]|uniref:uncharacterized protein LOC104898203 n=1 Tax=Beta vulgaris subsp. vulgaris TaxID=3555 RepID=UPI0020374489|nr:uncharacterized protein LOC104898203 [Beta vulgaris subsp. vulgaris]